MGHRARHRHFATESNEAVDPNTTALFAEFFSDISTEALQTRLNDEAGNYDVSNCSNLTNSEMDDSILYQGQPTAKFNIARWQIHDAIIHIDPHGVGFSADPASSCSTCWT